MFNITMRRIFSFGTLAVALGLLMPGGAVAQERVRDFTDGDGRIHGAPVLQVTEQDLHPGQVQTINLHPRFHSVLEFPYPIAQVHTGDPDVFMASIVGNKLTLKATRVVETETNMSVVLGDANLTIVPFLVRADSTQPLIYVVRYTDPVAQHLNAAEAEIAARLESDVDVRVERLAEERLRQRLLYSSRVVEINKSEIVGSAGERFGLTIQTAQRIPGPAGEPRMYLRYRVFNQTVAPLSDLHFVVRIHRHERKWLFFDDTDVREVYDVEDVRTVSPIPAGTAAEGLLIMEAVDLQDNETMSIEAIGFNGQRRVTIERVLVGD